MLSFSVVVNRGEGQGEGERVRGMVGAAGESKPSSLGNLRQASSSSKGHGRGSCRVVELSMLWQESQRSKLFLIKSKQYQFIRQLSNYAADIAPSAAATASTPADPDPGRGI